MFLAYADAYGIVYSCLFVEVILEHLKRCGFDLQGLSIQTDNGSEFIGAWNKRGDLEFTKKIESEKFNSAKDFPEKAAAYQFFFNFYRKNRRATSLFMTPVT